MFSNNRPYSCDSKTGTFCFLQINYEALTRGATGNVWFTLENTGEAEIEILTATRAGQNPSGELVFSLRDPDGNPLSIVDFKQAVGQGVITLSNGDTVARIPAGAIFTSQPVQIPAITSSP